MSSMVHKIERYSVQVLNKRSGGPTVTSVIVRLYNDKDEMCGTAVFRDYGDNAPEPPVGDYVAQSATAFYDIAFFEPLVGTLRFEDELFWKIAWVQTGPRQNVSDVSLDTKKEIIGEYFARPSTT